MNNKSLKLLFFATEDWFVCSHWLPLIIAAKNDGFNVVVVTRVNKHLGQIQQHGIKVIPFKISRRGSNIFSEAFTVYRLFKIYRSEKPDIVHHVAMKPMLYGSFVARLTQVKFTVNWVAGMGWLFISNKWRAKIIQGIIRKVLGLLLRSTEVIVENADDKKVIENLRVNPKNIHLVRGAGVDTLLYTPSPEPNGIPIVVLPARMLLDKGVSEFVEAAKKIKKLGISARLVLVGDLDEENPASVTKHQLADWQKEGDVECWGRREDMPYVLGLTHIVCLPSYREGLPKSLLEAASCGRAIVTTDVPGCREIVRDGDNGILVPPRDSTALAKAIVKLLIEPELRHSMGKRGRERILNEFSQEIIVSQVLAIYRMALS